MSKSPRKSMLSGNERILHALRETQEYQELKGLSHEMRIHKIGDAIRDNDIDTAVLLTVAINDMTHNQPNEKVVKTTSRRNSREGKVVEEDQETITKTPTKITKTVKKTVFVEPPKGKEAVNTILKKGTKLETKKSSSSSSSSDDEVLVVRKTTKQLYAKYGYIIVPGITEKQVEKINEEARKKTKEDGSILCSIDKLYGFDLDDNNVPSMIVGEGDERVFEPVPKFLDMLKKHGLPHVLSSKVINEAISQR